MEPPPDPDELHDRLADGEYRDVSGRSAEITGPDQRGECWHMSTVDGYGFTYWRCGARASESCRELATPVDDDPPPF